jgi:hypothetical protein
MISCLYSRKNQRKTLPVLLKKSKENTMHDSSSKKAATFLKPNSRDLKPLSHKLKELDQLTAKIITYLPTKIRAYCQIANVCDNRLIILVANGAVATQLRFESYEILARFKQDARLKKIQSIDVKVRPPIAEELPIRRRVAPPQQVELLSAETANMVNMVAESLRDPKLQEVMRRIARHVKNS